MARKNKAPAKSRSRKAAEKPTRDELHALMRKHYPRAKKAVQQVLKDTGLGQMKVHSMNFSVNESAVADNCDPPCRAGESCQWSSTGEWVCVKDGGS
jgi:hypothetical protein